MSNYVVFFNAYKRALLIIFTNSFIIDFRKDALDHMNLHKHSITLYLYCTILAFETKNCWNIDSKVPMKA